MSTREDREWDELQDYIADALAEREAGDLMHPDLTRELHDNILWTKQLDVPLAEIDDQIQSAMEGFDIRHGFFPSIDRWDYQEQEVVDTVLEQYGIDPE